MARALTTTPIGLAAFLPAWLALRSSRVSGGPSWRTTRRRSVVGPIDWPDCAGRRSLLQPRQPRRYAAASDVDSRAVAAPGNGRRRGRLLLRLTSGWVPRCVGHRCHPDRASARQPHRDAAADRPVGRRLEPADLPRGWAQQGRVGSSHSGRGWPTSPSRPMCRLCLCTSRERAASCARAALFRSGRGLV